MLTSSNLYRKIKLNNDILNLIEKDDTKNIKLLIWILNEVRLNHKPVTLNYKDLNVIWSLNYRTRKSLLKMYLNRFILKYSDNIKLLDITIYDKTIQFMINKKYINYLKIDDKCLLFNFKDIAMLGVDNFYTHLFLYLMLCRNKKQLVLDKNELLNITNMASSTSNTHLKLKLSNKKFQEFSKIFINLKYKIQYINGKRSNVKFIFKWNTILKHKQHVYINITDKKIGYMLNGLNSMNSNYQDMLQALINYEHKNHIIIDNKDEILSM